MVTGMSEVEELNIVKNKIDRIEDFSIPSPNVIRSINFEGNHLLEIPTLESLSNMRVEKVDIPKTCFGIGPCAP